MNAFARRGVGIAISDAAIFVTELKKGGPAIRLVSLSRVDLPDGVVMRGKVKDKKKLSEALIKAFREARPRPISTKDAMFAIPEQDVYIHTFSSQKGEDDGEGKTVMAEAEKNIPLPADDLLLSERTIPGTEDRQEVRIVAISRKEASDWRSFFLDAGIVINSFDAGSLARARALFPDGEKKTVCIIEVADTTFYISVLDRGIIVYSGTVYEEKGSESAVGELARALKYFSEKRGRKVEEVVIVGEISQAKELEKSLQSSLKISTRLGRLQLAGNDLPLSYAKSIGSALYSLGIGKEGLNLSLPDNSPKSRQKRTLAVLRPKLPSLPHFLSTFTTFTIPYKREVLASLTLVLVLSALYWSASEIFEGKSNLPTYTKDEETSSETQGGQEKAEKSEN